jgi:hypothetical protein
MKKFTYILFISTMMLTFASCANIEKILIKNNGKWNIDRITSTTEITGFPSTTDEDLNAGTILFEDSGTGTIEYNDGTSETFDWQVTDDVITIDFNATGFTIDYDILESSKNSQSWRGTIEETFSGITTIYTQEVELSAI